MLKLTKLNGEQIYVNADHIELLECTPDTIITLVNGRKYIVKEKLDAVVLAFIQYKQLIKNNITIINRTTDTDIEDKETPNKSKG
jgi:flagellar protein FlbD